MTSHSFENQDLHSQAQILLQISNLSIHYKNHYALKDVTGHIIRGSMTAVTGPNGGGKSTFLKSLVGLIPSTEGQINRSLNMSKEIAYLPQRAEIDLNFPLTVEDVAGLGLCQKTGFFQSITPQDQAQVDTALQDVGLQGYGDRLLNTLSGGQLQRVLFARLAVQDADLLLLDEPFAAVDAHTIEDLMKILLKWHARGKTIIVVSHDLDLIKTYFKDSILLAQQCIGWGNTSEIITPENFLTARKISTEWENYLQPDENNTLRFMR